WALTFYLTENLPRPYANYMRHTASRQAFVDYPSEERLKDFTRFFGTDLKMFDARLQRFISEVK
ncbi:MAG: hypothetical protein KDB23_18845, partial [Planctomycetales bacterium]|nr:hypothetical protein [Planctomycetales bacterium]